MDDQRQLRGAGHPHRTEHRAGGRVECGARGHQCLIGQLADNVQAVAGVNSSRLRNKQRPVTIVVLQAKTQRGVPVQQRLQDDDHIVLRHGGRHLNHQRLIELDDGAVDVAQPMHDWGDRHRTETFVGHIGFAAGYFGHRGQPRHRLFDEYVSRPAQYARRPRAGHHLHRQDAVPAQVKEGVVDTHALNTEHLCVHARENLLHRVAGGSIVGPQAAVFGSRQRSGVQLVVGGQRQCLQHHHCGRNHIGRKTFGQNAANFGGIRGSGDIPDQAFVARAILAHDRCRLVHSIESAQRRLNLAELDAVSADLDLLIGTAQVLQLSVVTPQNQVARAIHASTRFPERACHEA
ncbi:Uncharacterised protein [Mycobacteroides abscessus subsp. abscessus]|nr:Uncharacterised protein [Mycobacteroides abscessus subsp. abscessus]SKY22966.1 Uncharacterised protein [Mycobacteroides abscessus subsp. abscessus]SLG16940.1 Uncharacterised protein [Mycobacteroides abscessus subsp. abscessus]